MSRNRPALAAINMNNNVENVSIAACGRTTRGKRLDYKEMNSGRQMADIRPEAAEAQERILRAKKPRLKKSLDVLPSKRAAEGGENAPVLCQREDGCPALGDACPQEELPKGGTRRAKKPKRAGVCIPVDSSREIVQDGDIEEAREDVTVVPILGTPPGEDQLMAVDHDENRDADDGDEEEKKKRQAWYLKKPGSEIFSMLTVAAEAMRVKNSGASLEEFIEALKGPQCPINCSGLHTRLEKYKFLTKGGMQRLEPWYKCMRLFQGTVDGAAQRIMSRYAAMAEENHPLVGLTTKQLQMYIAHRKENSLNSHARDLY